MFSIRGGRKVRRETIIPPCISAFMTRVTARAIMSRVPCVPRRQWEHLETSIPFALEFRRALQHLFHQPLKVNVLRYLSTNGGKQKFQTIKPQHWRRFSAIFALEAAPVLDFRHFLH
jgi:hypothetical protein